MYLGLLFAVLTGLTWVITGAIVGSAERRGCGAFRQQLVSTVLSLSAVSIALVAGGRLFPDAAAFAFGASPLPALCMVAWGFLNFWMIFFMGRAMARGPNGLAWTVTQSGLVFPFLMGVLSGRTDLTWARAAGFAMIVGNVVVSGFARGGASKGGSTLRWFLPALAAFVLCGANQCAVNLVSYLPADIRPENLERMLWGGVGTLAAWAVFTAGKRLLEGPAPRDPDLRGKYLFLLRVCGLAIIPGFVASCWFHFNALDRLEAAGAIAIASPMEVNACLIGFFLYGRLALRERTTALQNAAFAMGLLGVVLIALG